MQVCELWSQELNVSSLRPAEGSDGKRPAATKVKGKDQKKKVLTQVW